MATAAERPADYVYMYAIALLPGVAEDEFERHILHEVLPHFNVTHRPIGAVALTHSLLKRGDDEAAERYVWEIRVRFFVRISGVPDEAALTKMDELVRAGLAGLGSPATVTVLHEVGTADTQWPCRRPATPPRRPCSGHVRAAPRPDRSSLSCGTRSTIAQRNRRHSLHQPGIRFPFDQAPTRVPISAKGFVRPHIGQRTCQPGANRASVAAACSPPRSFVLLKYGAPQRSFRFGARRLRGHDRLPGEVLVSSSVKNLVAGSGFQFEDPGSHTGSW